jgi:hypothetical protein
VSITSFIKDSHQFAAYRKQVDACFHIKASLPSQVFREKFIRFGFEEFDWVMSSKFWSTIQALCQTSDDTSLLLAVLEPDPTNYYKKEFGYFNWATFSTSASPEEYWDILNRCPDGSPADSLLANSEKVVWLPQSGKWAIWGERSVEVCILGCQTSEYCGWHSVDWAVEVAMPSAFRDGIIPPEYAERFRRNYGAATQG